MALNKLPDIDIDFAHDRKDDVVDLIFERYGPRHAAIVGGLSTYQGRSAVADIAKVLGVSEFQIRRLTEHVPRSSAGHVAAAVASTQECHDSPWQRRTVSHRACKWRRSSTASRGIRKCTRAASCFRAIRSPR